ncbi:MAG: M6 family metalloprotease domain-containing protein, partial [Prevotella sp.]|nr:M6 family metalloprotease domain-containing protein [Prevotella sp.]
MKKLLLTLCLMLTAVASWAVKAYPEPVVVTQSDGSQLTVIGYGDEDFHWYTSSDGVLLAQKGRDFFVAAIDENGLMTATEQLAHNPSDRLEAEKQLIAKQTPRREAFFNHATARKMAAAQRRISIGTTTPAYFPHSGEPRAMVILVDFPDQSFSGENPLLSFNDYLNKEGSIPDRGLHEHYNSGSVRKYFTDMSEGLFRPKFDIFGPVTMSNTSAYYGKDKGSTKDEHLNELIKEACAAIDGEVDFSQYDSNGDGYVDLVYIIYAGYSQSVTGNSDDCIWPKSGAGSFGTYDGVKVSRYGVNNELNHTPSLQDLLMNGIGLFC